jgi:hypothetical protein
LREDPPVPKHFRHLNATRHGLRAASLALPWEDPGEFARLREDLVAEHAPQGPTEAALVDELTGVLWRLRRVHVAEAAAWRSGFRETLARYNGREELVGAAVPAAIGTDTEVGALALTGPEKAIAAERRDARRVTETVQLALSILDRAGVSPRRRPRYSTARVTGGPSMPRRKKSVATIPRRCASSWPGRSCAGREAANSC